MACVDESGTLQVELLDEMKAYGAGDDDDVVEGDFAPGVIEQEAITITVDVFRYAPEAAESGWDTLTCASSPATPRSRTCSSRCRGTLTAALHSVVVLEPVRRRPVCVSTDESCSQTLPKSAI